MMTLPAMKTNADAGPRDPSTERPGQPSAPRALDGARRARAGLLGAWSVLSLLAGEAQAANLLANGDAEAHRCTTDWSAQTPVPGWRVLRGAASVLCYSAFATARESPSLPAADRGGRALFAAPGADTALTQDVDLTALATGTDTGRLQWRLSGWLGGVSGGPGATLSLVLLDAAGRAIAGPVVLAPLAAAHAPGSVDLDARSAAGTLPPGTRTARLTLQLPTRPSHFHESFADNLRFEVVGAAGPMGTEAVVVAPPPGPRLDRVFVVMMENTNYADVVDPSGQVRADRMPWLAAAAAKGLGLGAMWANYHPSDQNYIAMVAGDTFVPGPKYFPEISLDAPHVGDRLEAAGRPWRAYVQGMAKPCNLAVDAPGHGHYAPDDEPFAHFSRLRADPDRCAAHLRDLGDLARDARSGNLPAFAWIAADGWWDGEGAWEDSLDVPTSLRRQDEFLRDTLTPLLDSAAWKDGRSLLVITWDESLGWGWPDNQVPTVLLGSERLALPTGVDPSHYDGYSVLRSIEDGLGLPTLGRFDTHAQPLRLSLPDARSSAEDVLDADPASATTGDVHETYGQPRGPVSAYRGEVLRMRGRAGTAPAVVAVAIAPLGRAPTGNDPAVRALDDAGGFSIPTADLAPGAYAAWPVVQGEAMSRPALPFQVLEPPDVDPAHPGLVARGAQGGPEPPLRLREGANLVVRYCRPAGTPPERAWIGVFPRASLPGVKSRPLDASPGDWVAVPAACGEAMIHTAGREPASDLRVQMFVDDDAGRARPVGRNVALHITPTLPQSR